MLVPFTAGQKLTAATLNAAFDITRQVYQTATQTRNNSTAFLDSTSLVLSVAANSAYLYESVIAYDTGATPDFKHRITLPTGSFLFLAPWQGITTIAATSNSIHHQASDDGGTAAITFSSGGVAAGTWMTLKPAGIIATSTTAGNCQIAFAQVTANVSDTKLLTGSWIRLTKVL